MSDRKIPKYDGMVSAAILAAVCVLILSFTYFGFSPPYSQYVPLIHLAFYPGDFASDPVLTGSVYLQASIYYKAIALLGLPITNDWIGLTLHYVLNGGVLFLVYRVARCRLDHFDRPSAICLAIVLCLISSTFVMGSLSSVISIKTPTPTGLAHVAGMAALLFAALQRIGVAAVLCTICVAITPKGTLLIVPALLLYVLIDRSISRSALVWFVLPIGYIGWRALASPVAPMPAAEAVEMIELIFRREEEDGQFLQQPWLANLFFCLSVIAFPFAARLCPHKGVRKLGYALLATTVGAVAFNLVYSAAYAYFPVPLLAMLSIPQATKYFLFFFSMLVVSWVVKTEELYWHEKLAVILAIVVLKPLPLQSYIAIGLVTVGLLLPRLLRNTLYSDWKEGGLHRLFRLPDRIIPAPLAIGVFLAAFVVARSGDTYVAPSWVDLTSYRNSGNWSAAVWADEETWQVWQKLASRRDFPLLAIYKRQPPGQPPRYASHPAAYATARKSPFASLPAHAYLDFDLWRESQKRYEVRLRILDKLNAGEVVANERLGTITIRKEGIPLRVDENIIDFLASRNVQILVPGHLAEKFPDAANKQTIGRYALLKF